MAVIAFGLFFILAITQVNGASPSTSSSKSANHLRLALPGRKDSDPAFSSRYSFRSEGEFHSVYEKGPVVPGAGIRKQHYFISEDYTVYDGSRERVIPFFDPEKWMNCDCDLPFPAELDIPHRFAVYHPVTVQAPLPVVPKDMYAVKYTGHYYACPVYANPYDYAWYLDNQSVNPCRWIWYQSVEDSTANLRHK